MNHKQSLDRPTTLPTRKANPQTTKRHQVPSRSPSLNQPSLTAHSKTFHLPLFQRTPYLSLISSSKYVPKRDKGAMQVGTLNHHQSNQRRLFFSPKVMTHQSLHYMDRGLRPGKESDLCVYTYTACPEAGIGVQGTDDHLDQCCQKFTQG